MARVSLTLGSQEWDEGLDDRKGWELRHAADLDLGKCRTVAVCWCRDGPHTSHAHHFTGLRSYLGQNGEISNGKEMFDFRAIGLENVIIGADL